MRVPPRARGTVTCIGDRLANVVARNGEERVMTVNTAPRHGNVFGYCSAYRRTVFTGPGS